MRVEWFRRQQVEVLALLSPVQIDVDMVVEKRMVLAPDLRKY
jgi:hypothetical protein